MNFFGHSGLFEKAKIAKEININHLNQDGVDEDDGLDIGQRQQRLGDEVGDGRDEEQHRAADLHRHLAGSGHAEQAAGKDDDDEGDVEEVARPDDHHGVERGDHGLHHGVHDDEEHAAGDHEEDGEKRLALLGVHGLGQPGRGDERGIKGLSGSRAARHVVYTNPVARPIAGGSRRREGASTAFMRHGRPAMPRAGSGRQA